MLTIDSNLQSEFENFGRIPTEPLNMVFLQASEKIIAGKIDRDLEDSDLSADVKLAFFSLALWLYNNRDFVSKQDSKAVNDQANILLAGVTNLSRYIPEDSNA